MMKPIYLLLIFSGLCYAQVTVTSPAVFTGSGLNDATSGGIWTPLPTNASYVVTISATGTPDQFTWTLNNGTASAPIAITGSVQTLSNGITVTFAATTGHSLADYWTIKVSANSSSSSVNWIHRLWNAITRTSQDKMRDTVSVRDFGAQGDGSSDDTAAFQNAINAVAKAGYNASQTAPGATVHVPIGHYIVGPLFMSRGVRLECDSMAEGSTLMMKSNSETMLTFSNAAFSGAANCFIDSNGKTGTTGIEEDTTPTNNHFSNIAMNNLGTCVTTTSAYFNLFENVRCYGPTSYGFLFGNSSNSLTCIDCSVYSSATSTLCLQVAQSLGVTISGGTYEANCYIQVYGTNGTTIAGNYFENATGMESPYGWINLGIGSPYLTSGTSITGNTFRGGAPYALQIQGADGVTVSANDIAADTDAFFIVNNVGATYPNRGLNLGNNTYNIGGLGYDPTKLLAYNANPTTENTLNSNTNQEVIDPLLFTAPLYGTAYAFKEPPDPSIMNNQAALYWDGTALWAKFKNSSGTIFHTQISDPGNVHTVGPAGTGGQLVVNTPSLNSSFPSWFNVSGTYGSLLSTIILDAYGVQSGGGYTSNFLFRTYTGSSNTGSVTFDNGGGVTASSLAGSGTRCLQATNAGMVQLSAAACAATLTAGTSISIVGNAINNTAPFPGGTTVTYTGVPTGCTFTGGVPSGCTSTTLIFTNGLK